MRTKIHLVAIALLTAISLSPESEAADTSSRLDCAAGLTPDLTSLKYSRDVRLVYLRTLTEEQWKEAKKEYGASFPELFSGTYNDYLTARSKVFEKIEYRFDDKVALSLFIQRLSDTARTKFFECVIALAKLRAGGVAVYFLDETETGATLRVEYNNAPPSPNIVKITFDPRGTTTKLPPKSIARGGSQNIEVDRQKGADIRVSVNVVNGTGDSVVSAMPRPKPIIKKVYDKAKSVPSVLSFNSRHFHDGGGDCGCPNCGECWWAELAPPGPDAEISTISTLGSNHKWWKRCGIDADCGTNEYTPTSSKQGGTGVTCAGLPRCVVWRTIDADPRGIVETFEITYRPWTMVCENCPRAPASGLGKGYRGDGR